MAKTNTTESITYAQAVAEIFHAVDARALAGISEADRAQFLRTFSAIIQNLNTLEGEET